MGGGGVGKKNSCKGKCQERKFVQRRCKEKKSGRKKSPIAVIIKYIKYATKVSIKKRTPGVSKIQNVLGSLPQALQLLLFSVLFV